MTDALKMLREAIENEGPRPEVHREILRRHRKEWPTLWKAIDLLLGENEDHAITAIETS